MDVEDFRFHFLVSRDFCKMQLLALRRTKETVK